ncbi:acyl-CoA dehydrogenase family protein [Nocardia sp. NPDC005825]|uniref:acyl-CoA dehydrogenase family protein n=1 Tax=unclassified Nocardia TaxID=2637762 RepID=UPI0033F4AD62
MNLLDQIVSFERVLLNESGRAVGPRVQEIFRNAFLRPVLDLTPIASQPDTATIALDAALTAELFGISSSVHAARTDGTITLSGVVTGVPITETTASIHVQARLDDSPVLITVPVRSDGVAVRRQTVGVLEGFTTADIQFTDCELSADRSVTDFPDDFERLAAIVETTRILLCALGGAVVRQSLDSALDHTARRKMAGGKLIDYQVVRHRLAEIAGRQVALQAATTFLASTGTAADRARHAAQLALTAGRLITEAVADCCQFYGGRGLLQNYPIAVDYQSAHRLASLLGRGDLLSEVVGALAASRAFAETAEAHEDPSLRSFRTRCRTFVESKIAPHHRDWDHTADLPRALFEDFAEAGFTGLIIDRDLGGAGGTFEQSRILIDELMRYPVAGVMTSLVAQSHGVLPLIARLGSPDQRRTYLAPSLAGELVSGIAITDPSGGSDLVRSIRLDAERSKHGWVLNGQKLFITNGPIADFLVVLARTDPRRGALGFTLFLVDTSNPGFSVKAALEKTGLRASPTGWLEFVDCYVPDSAVLGTVGNGFPEASTVLSNERLLISVCAAATARRSLETAVHIDWDDVTKGTAAAADIAEVFVLETYFADMMRRRDHVGVSESEAACAKFLSAELVQRVIRNCFRSVSGSVFSDPTYLTDSYRDSRVLGVFSGSSETMREVYANKLVNGYGIGPSAPVAEFDNSLV